MSAYSFVTSMSLKGYEQYGKKFVETFRARCNLPLFVYSEDRLPIAHIPLQNDPDWLKFQENPDDPPDWKFQAKRFSHKVFALTNWRDYDWWVWIDADVEVFGTLDNAFLKEVCRGDISYIGRKNYASECGWVAYNMETCGPFLQRFREIYTSGEIYSHLEWHDSYIFDRVREEFPLEYHNLAEGIGGMHPWDSTVLGEKMRHLKGPLRKQGVSLDHLPEEYRSVAE